MSEKKLWARIRQHLPGEAERVENIVEPGMPDVYGDCDEGSYWIELKSPKTISCNDPVKLLRPAQRAWFVRHLVKTHNRGVYFVCVECRKKIILFYASMVDSELYLLSVFEYSGPLRKDNKLKQAIVYILKPRGI